MFMTGQVGTWGTRSIAPRVYVLIGSLLFIVAEAIAVFLAIKTQRLHFRSPVSIYFVPLFVVVPLVASISAYLRIREQLVAAGVGPAIVSLVRNSIIGLMAIIYSILVLLLCVLVNAVVVC